MARSTYVRNITFYLLIVFLEGEKISLVIKETSGTKVQYDYQRITLKLCFCLFLCLLFVRSFSAFSSLIIFNWSITIVITIVF